MHCDMFTAKLFLNKMHLYSFISMAGMGEQSVDKSMQKKKKKKEPA